MKRDPRRSIVIVRAPTRTGDVVRGRGGNSYRTEREAYAFEDKQQALDARQKYGRPRVRGVVVEVERVEGDEVIGYEVTRDGDVIGRPTEPGEVSSQLGVS